MHPCTHSLLTHLHTHSTTEESMSEENMSPVSVRISHPTNPFFVTLIRPLFSLPPPLTHPRVSYVIRSYPLGICVRDLFCFVFWSPINTFVNLLFRFQSFIFQSFVLCWSFSQVEITRKYASVVIYRSWYVCSCTHRISAMLALWPMLMMLVIPSEYAKTCMWHGEFANLVVGFLWCDEGRVKVCVVIRGEGGCSLGT